MKLNVPACVGVPVIAPVEVFSDKPGGSEPLMIENVYGGTPPVATRAELYGTPTCAVPPAQASEMGKGAITMLQFAVTEVAPAPLESVT